MSEPKELELTEEQWRDQVPDNSIAIVMKVGDKKFARFVDLAPTNEDTLDYVRAICQMATDTVEKMDIFKDHVSE